MEENFHVTWDHHQPKVLSLCNNLLQNGKLVDVTLAAEGKRLKAHRLVLSACSPYFELLLTEEYDKHPILILRDAKFQELEAIVEFMYKGEVDVPQNQMAEFLKLGKSLQIKGLEKFTAYHQQLTNNKRSGPDDEECSVTMSLELQKKQRVQCNNDASNSVTKETDMPNIIETEPKMSVNIRKETEMPNIIDTEPKILTQTQKDNQISKLIIDRNKQMILSKQENERALAAYLEKKANLGKLIRNNKPRDEVYLTPKQVIDPQKNSKNIKIFIGNKAYTKKMTNHQIFT
ncbi:unnamed protein product [Ceutorhynchus assimilis]|uniref:BTB domain-containing protein n=1 Tax=Ceutorhynchus assimilis TaxID=467358 RepID=A0A9N9QQ14_9CUCU|nr:unnamed protein product [Ceutorhynchus assimilis]